MTPHALLTNFSPLAPSPAGVRPAASPAPSLGSAAGTLSNPAVILPSGPQQTGTGNAVPFSFLCANSSSAFLMRAFIPTSENRTQVSLSSFSMPRVGHGAIVDALTKPLAAYNNVVRSE